MRKRHLLTTSIIAAATVAIASGAIAQETSSTDLTVVNIAGSRDMTILSVGGGAFTSVELGTAREVPFLANVTDLFYENVGYELNASMSNLYPLDGTTPVCGTEPGDFIPSGTLSVGFPAEDAFALGDVSALAEPVFTLTGTVSGTIASLTGLTVGDPLIGTLDGQQLDVALDELLNTLPLDAANGAGGAFAAPLAHPVCGAGATTPTPVGVQTGDPNDTFDFAALEATIFDLIADGALTLSPADLVSEDIFSQAGIDGAIRQAILDAGGTLPLLSSELDTVVAELRSTMTVTLDVAALLGQTGIYNTVAELVVGDLTSFDAGTYGGRLEFTLIDK
ncbi:MAG: hypothetical protein KY469_11885 [Actinobacteria bacterium]|nr:hypothetical protein [Actinomycetota bacterium]